MVKYTSQYQPKIGEFGNLYQMKLNPDNRWVLLAFHFPWDECAKIYAGHFPDSGRTAISPRIVIGSLVIKYKLNLSDDETVRIIEENPYMQFFPGLGNEAFNGFADLLATICHGGRRAGRWSPPVRSAGSEQRSAWPMPTASPRPEP